MMTIKELLEAVQFVVNSEGNKKGVQLDWQTWEALVAYLEAHEEEDATEELLTIPGLVEAIDRSRQRVKAGQFVRYEDIRRDVRCEM